MKRFIRLSALSMMALMLFSACGCSLFGTSKPSETPLPTENSAVIDNAMLESFVGDWYGVYTVAEARGIYAPNSRVSNDCAMRVAVDSTGNGVCYLQVNGMENIPGSTSSNVFSQCTAKLNNGSLDILGTINDRDIAWSFNLINNELKLVEVYGDVTDNMRIEITVSRPDAIAASNIIPEAMDYIIKNGFGGIVDMLGGKTSELPQVTVPEGCEPHLFFDGSITSTTPAPTTSANMVQSADGHITITLPDEYKVITNTVTGFIVACPEKGIKQVDFAVSTWNTDSLSFLLSNTPNITDLYHYTIDGFDFYGSFITPESEEGTPTEEPSNSTVFKLCGTNNTGSLIIINITMDLDAFSAYSYVNVDNADFSQLILGARFSMI